jgi:hypothetical protein
MGQQQTGRNAQEQQRQQQQSGAGTQKPAPQNTGNKGSGGKAGGINQGRR